MAIWAINHAASSKISHLGDFTKIGNGFTNHNGGIVVHADTGGLVLEQKMTMQTTVPALCSQMPPLIQQPYLLEIIPQNIADILIDNGTIDLVSVARKLGLHKRNMDHVSGKLCRSFVEPANINQLTAGRPLPIYDADGYFSFLYVLHLNATFEVKFFKYRDAPGTYPFFFKPTRSGVWFPEPRHRHPKWSFSTSAYIAVSNSNMGWICTAGGADALDWEIFRGIDSEVIWPYFYDDPLYTRNCFAEIFAIVTEAKRHGITMAVCKAEADNSPVNGFSFVEAEAVVLDMESVKDYAKGYGLPIDPIWQDNPYEIQLSPAGTYSTDMPFFWQSGFTALFYGESPDLLMMELLKLLSGQVRYRNCEPTKKKILIVVPHGYETRMKRRFQAFADDAIYLVKSELLKNQGPFELYLRDKKIEAVFFYASDNNCCKTFEVGMDLSVTLEIPVAIFASSEDAEAAFGQIVDQTYWVGGNIDDGIFVKSMATDEIKKYRFVSDQEIIIEPATESDISVVKENEDT